MDPKHPINNWEAAWDYLDLLSRPPDSDNDFGVKISLNVPSSFSGSDQYLMLWSTDRNQIVEMLRHAWLYIWETPTQGYPVELQPALNAALVDHEKLDIATLMKIFNEHSVVSVMEWFSTYGELRDSTAEWATDQRYWASLCIGLKPEDEGWEDAFKDYLSNMYF